MIVSKRFEFSSAHMAPQAGDERERRLHGHNYVLHVGVSGEPDSVTGVVLNHMTLEADVTELLDHYDRRHLNRLPGLAGSPGPVVEAVAEALWADLSKLVAPLPLGRVTLYEDDGDAAVVTPGATRAIARGEFAAAHRSHISTYSDAANRALFGICNNPAGHGHNYRLTVEAQAASETLTEAMREVLREFDHRNLSQDIPDLAGRSVSTEVIARLLWSRMGAKLSSMSAAGGRLERIRLNELSDFFAEYAGDGDGARLGRRYTFFATHRMLNPHLLQAENEAQYGRCSRAEPHGHSYRVEVTVAGHIDPETGLVMDLADLDGPALEVIGALDGQHLDTAVPALREAPSTGENIAAHLWRELESRFGESLARVRLWMTRTDCFEIDQRL
jgi:6-pyruvoyltetrahydropterin/6-carboxytetrahydropterin synthase